MILLDVLKQNSSLRLENGVFYQTDISKHSAFEQKYLSLRKQENRFYSDEIVKQLPGIPSDHAQKNEWLVRAISANKLIRYLETKGENKKILEVGCGNGWLAHKLASDHSLDVLALDVNEAELQQGARVFSSRNLCFIYGDVFTINLNPLTFDAIVLASSIQYFPNVQSLINRLLPMLNPMGEIHIIDSPFYRSDNDVIEAKKRSADHFAQLGHHEMSHYYFHHTIQEIGIFKYKILEDPDSIIAKIKRRLFKSSHPVFPWILIKAE